MRLGLNAVQGDRAAGVLLGAACGDALGVPYEFETRTLDGDPRMLGGGLGNYAPGEYSDDTQMAVCIAEVAATGADLRTPEALDQIARNFVTWRTDGATDIGNQTATVLGRVQGLPDAGLGSAMTEAAAALHRRTGHTAGNGSLMRTAPVALAHLNDPRDLAEAARAISDLTHFDPLAGDACVIWCEAIRHAVLEGTFAGMDTGLELIPEERRDQWASWLEEARQHPPNHFRNNGFVVAALQAAWSAINRTPMPEQDDPARKIFRCDHFRNGLYAAVRAGNDTDTVAAIAGALLGARWGTSGIPLQWQRLVHGWGGHRSADLIRMALLTTGGGRADRVGWPGCDQMMPPIDQPLMTVHPDDDGVVLGNLLTDAVESGVDAVVSLCRVGRRQFANVPAENQVQVWLVDQPGANANTAFALDQAARMVVQMRDEGHKVLLHCAAGQSRTPAVGARYAMLRAGRSGATALGEMRTLLADHGYLVNSELRSVVEAFG
ncbi:ADP-ribosylglycohydrolase family protein [Actinoplanes hulinensis]|uniref:ADP-ribosylglycohydrolase family protein n=1 Tax=Actinoplanes hulinensis TaxID=1144547 RepID=A0ABS7BEH2_9ACTN|nr:ADP-ribosylglycohydrolase family protein [Actinoplanes hulinensis]MBW6439260.1 ADP-ribosylglycohydrolase family protein [Actinoplanes hulinensis]MBW6439271.1 ADP-ribosylglycohydrolase family protein [Actinoplanes hulinensis]